MDSFVAFEFLGTSETKYVFSLLFFFFFISLGSEMKCQKMVFLFFGFSFGSFFLGRLDTLLLLNLQ